MNRRWFRSIARQYGLHARIIKPCRSVYKKAAAYQVQTDEGNYFLKPFNRSKKRLDRIYAQTVWLTQLQFRHMPQWLTTSNGAHSVKKSGRHYYVSEWIDGCEWGANEHDYERLGEVLGQLHFDTRRPVLETPSFAIKDIRFFQQQHRMFLRLLPSLRKNGQSIGKWFRGRGEQCRILAEDAWNTLRQPNVRQAMLEEKPSFIHGDVTRPNVIFSESGIYLVDWEFARYGSAYYEVAKTLNNITDFSVPNMIGFLAGYEKRCPLTPEERLIIASMFRLPREAWVTARQFRAGRRIFNLAKMEALWAKRLEALHWMDSWARQQPPEAGTSSDVVGNVDGQ